MYISSVVSAGSLVMSTVVREAVDAANIPARRSAVSRRTIHVAVSSVHSETGTVETVVVARSLTDRTLRCRIRWAVVRVISADIATRRPGILLRSTIALTVNRMVPVRTVARVIMASTVGVESAEVVARVHGVDGRSVNETLTVDVVSDGTRSGREITLVAVFVVESFSRH